MTDGKCQAVILLGFGGPVAPAEVRPFLDRVLAGRPVPPERYEEVVQHYAALGGRSPYNQLTMEQAEALHQRLRREGPWPVAAAFRHSAPFIDQVLQQLHRQGVGRAFAFVLAPHRSEASWDRYLEDVRAARERLGREAPEIEYAPPWHDAPLFIEAVAARTRAAMERLPVEQQHNAELIFTAHSIPLAMAGRATYVEQLQESARLVAAALGTRKWTLAFQSHGSRGGWLEPGIGQVLAALPSGTGVVVPLGFLCDHVEVLYDLDIEAAQIAHRHGVRMERAATVGDHPKFIQLIAAIARRYLSPARPNS